MSESDTIFNERDRRCAAVQLMLSTDPSYLTHRLELKDMKTLGQSRPRSDYTERIFHIRQNSQTVDSSLDAVQFHSLEIYIYFFL